MRIVFALLMAMTWGTGAKAATYEISANENEFSATFTVIGPHSPDYFTGTPITIFVRPNISFDQSGEWIAENYSYVRWHLLYRGGRTADEEHYLPFQSIEEDYTVGGIGRACRYIPCINEGSRAVYQSDPDFTLLLLFYGDGPMRIISDPAFSIFITVPDGFTLASNDDIANVPLPLPFLLFGSGLVLLSVAQWRRAVT